MRLILGFLIIASLIIVACQPGEDSKPPVPAVNETPDFDPLKLSSSKLSLNIRSTEFSLPIKISGRLDRIKTDIDTRNIINLKFDIGNKKSELITAVVPQNVSKPPFGSSVVYEFKGNNIRHNITMYECDPGNMNCFKDLLEFIGIPTSNGIVTPVSILDHRGFRIEDIYNGQNISTIFLNVDKYILTSAYVLNKDDDFFEKDQKRAIDLGFVLIILESIPEHETKELTVAPR